MIRLESVLKMKTFARLCKTPWRCLEDVLKTSWKRLEDFLKLPWRRFCKTPWRRFEDVLKTSWRRLEDVWPRRIYWSWSRRLQDVLKTYEYGQYVRLDQNVLKTSSKDEEERRLHQDECLLGRCIGVLDSLHRWLFLIFFNSPIYIFFFTFYA